jgi:hypothetical protein
MKYLREFSAYKEEPEENYNYKTKELLEKITPDINEVTQHIFDFIQEYLEKGENDIYVEFGRYNSKGNFISICNINSEDQYDEAYKKSKDKEFFKKYRFGRANVSMFLNHNDKENYIKLLAGKDKLLYRIRFSSDESSKLRDDDPHDLEIIDNINNGIQSTIKRLSKKYKVSIINSEYFDCINGKKGSECEWVKSENFWDPKKSANIIVDFTVN